MQTFLYRYDALVMIIAFVSGRYLAEGSIITPSTPPATSFVLPITTSSPITTCEFRTINYITHNLPQVCLRYAWSDSARFEIPHATATHEKTSSSFGTEASPEESRRSMEGLTSVDSDADSALDDSSFLSFEDWRKQTLEKEGLLDPSTGERRAQVSKDGERRQNSNGIQDALEALEEDVVIETHFTTFLGKHGGDAGTELSQPDHVPTQSTMRDALKVKHADVDDNRRFRSTDAGKTCKERFNFASLDAGGQVMKTNTEARSASALLKEDRDVYMLNSCQAKNKFLIVELSESILVETVAIANFEFFSSTFRQFRISVSDRYPVKMDRWVDLGTFEARNSRDIQAFLVEDPRIWARYFRVEFLSHYGNEFYCPVSLLRVHGRTMIQDVLGMEEPPRGEDDIEDNLEDLEQNGEIPVSEAVANLLEEENRVAEGLREAEAALEELVKTAEAITFPQRIVPLNSSQIIEAKRWLENVSLEQMTTLWVKGESLLTTLFEDSQLTGFCYPSDGPLLGKVESQGRGNETNIANEVYQSQKAAATLDESSAISTPSRRPGPDTNAMTAIEQLTDSLVSSLHEASTVTLTSKESATSQPVNELNSSTHETATSSVKSLNKTSLTTSLHSPQPTTQESFFKTVTKRLQLLEANSTLSLKYIEEQSRILRDAFTKVEKRQLGKTTTFLENLNGTVLEELRKFSQQYEEVWQSTVIELETQRDQAQREIAAISTRLSMLADELVFQKRMSIVQSILLLLCLGLVIFSRNPVAGYIDIPVIQNMVAKARNRSDISVDSSPNGPPTGPSLRVRPWPGVEHRRQRSDESAGSLRSGSRDYSPATPVSAYSLQGEDRKPVNEEDDILKDVRPSFVTSPLMMQGGNPEIVDSQLPKWRDSDAISGDESYPDFGNSALWLAPGATVLDTNNMVHYKETCPGGKGQNTNDETYKCKPDRIMNAYFDGGGTRPPAHSSRPPSTPPEMDRPEFSIARKPLPALPRDGQ